jgi:hypothetical protein
MAFLVFQAPAHLSWIILSLLAAVAVLEMKAAVAVLVVCVQL